MTGPHRRVDGGAAGLAGVDSSARMARRGMDGDAARVAQRRPTWDDGKEGQRGQDDARTRRHDVLTSASDGVDGSVDEDGGVRGEASGWAIGVALSERGHGDGTVGRRLSRRRRAVPTAPLRHGVARSHGSHAATAC
jgi:hypothetical protein